MIMYITLVRIYSKTRNMALLDNAVTKGWITETEKQQIMDAE